MALVHELCATVFTSCAHLTHGGRVRVASESAYNLVNPTSPLAPGGLELPIVPPSLSFLPFPSSSLARGRVYPPPTPYPGTKMVPVAAGCEPLWGPLVPLGPHFSEVVF